MNYRHKLVFYTPSDPGTPDPRGDEKPTYAVFKTVYGTIDPLAGREFQFAQQIRADVTHKVSIRYTSGLNARMYFIWNGRTFQVGPMLNGDESNNTQSFYAVEKV